MKNSRIETERLYMIPVSLEHCTLKYLSWLNDDEITRYLETKSSTMEELKSYILKKMATDDLFFAIHLKNNDSHIGNIKIEALHPVHKFAEYGILMGDKDEWCKGYAFEASIAFLTFAFQQLNIRKLNLGVVAEHSTAVQLYKRIGFKTEGELKSHAYYNGEYKDCLRMAIFENDF